MSEGAGCAQPGDKGGLVALCNYLTEGCNQVGVRLLSQSDRTRANALKFHQGKFRLGIKKFFFIKMVIK